MASLNILLVGLGKQFLKIHFLKKLLSDIDPQKMPVKINCKTNLSIKNNHPPRGKNKSIKKNAFSLNR